MNSLQLKDSKYNTDSLGNISGLIFDDNLVFYNEQFFHLMLRLERKRTERSKRPFLLMQLNISSILKNQKKFELLEQLKRGLFSCARETDVKGWYKENELIGIIFTEMGCIDESVIEKMLLKIYSTLYKIFSQELVKHISISYHIYPEDHENKNVNKWFNLSLYPDLTWKSFSNRKALFIKRSMDVFVSSLALIIISPVFLIIEILIKLTSNGPVLFKQERIGLHGEKFTFLKFRSMYTNSEENTHKEYIKKLICEQKSHSISEERGARIYKLKYDSRITPFGMFLRKTSLDELPQFINVLKGEMSLVGPRPPIPYECELYDIWQRRRILEVKPGITGLWQVKGRSATSFDEMVRLDLKYINEWSLWLDIKILFKTPWVVVNGKGAY